MIEVVCAEVLIGHSTCPQENAANLNYGRQKTENVRLQQNFPLHTLLSGPHPGNIAEYGLMERLKVGARVATGIHSMEARDAG